MLIIKAFFALSLVALSLAAPANQPRQAGMFLFFQPPFGTSLIGLTHNWP
jgi:hypothetical protein